MGCNFVCENINFKILYIMRNYLLVLFAFFAFGSASADGPVFIPKDTEPIPLNPNLPTNEPRTIVLGVEAYYFFGNVAVIFNADLGDADIVVVNTTTGESWSNSVNGVGTATLALSGDEGYYEIYIYTDCGDYTGTFII